MTSKTRIRVEDCGKIVAFVEVGLSYREIANRVGCSLGAVSHIVRKQKETGTVQDRPIPGRKRVTTTREDRAIVRISLADRRKTAPAIKADVETYNGLHVSISTVKRRLKESGLRAYRVRKKPLLTKKHRRRRLEFARAHRHWSADDWSKVVWSDESCFQLFHNDGLPYVRHTAGEEFQEDCVAPTVKHGGGSIMVWGCMSEVGVGELRLVSGRLNAASYVALLEDALRPSVRSLGLEGEFIFQQDNAPAHMAKTTKRWMSSVKIAVLEWPAQSPDLNPIEHAWDQLGTSLAGRVFHSQGELWEYIQEAWKKLSRVSVANLVASMPRRIEAVIKSRGGCTRY